MATPALARRGRNDLIPGAKKDAILRAATDVFAERGFFNAQVADVAHAAGVAAGTVYLYFRSKDDLLVEFHTASGDLESDIPSNVNRHNRKEYSVALGDARGHAVVKTVSGDLSIRATNIDVPGEPTTEEPSAVRADMHASYDSEAEHEEEHDAERTERMDPEASQRVRGVLEKLAKGEIGLDDAASALDEARRSAPRGPSPLSR